LLKTHRGEAETIEKSTWLPTWGYRIILETANDVSPTGASAHKTKESLLAIGSFEYG
jgi:hypothetical protein